MAIKIRYTLMLIVEACSVYFVVSSYMTNYTLVLTVEVFSRNFVVSSYRTNYTPVFKPMLSPEIYRNKGKIY